MSAWILWMLTGIGVTYAISESAICAPFRLLVSKLGVFAVGLIYCPACTGFWVGAALGGMGALPWETSPSLGAEIIVSAICMMAVTASWSAWKGPSPAYAIEQGEEDVETTKIEG